MGTFLHAYLSLDLRNCLDECIEWQVNYGYQTFHEFIIKIQKKTPENAIFSIFNSRSKHNFHSNITYCKITYTQIHFCKHTNQNSIHPIHILTIHIGKILVFTQVSQHSSQGNRVSDFNSGLSFHSVFKKTDNLS